jgi:hypothetical protein
VSDPNGKTKKVRAGTKSDIATFIASEILARWDHNFGAYLAVVQTTRGGLVVKVFPKRSGERGGATGEPSRFASGDLQREVG